MKNGRVIVKNNILFSKKKGDLFDKNRIMIYVAILALASALSYYFFKVFLIGFPK